MRRVDEIVGVNTELEELMEVADVNGSQRLTFRSDPDRALRLLKYAMARPKIRNPAAFALTRFRAEQDAPGVQAQAEAEPERLPVAELEAALTFARAHGLPSVAIASIEQDLAAARAEDELHPAA